MRSYTCSFPLSASHLPMVIRIFIYYVPVKRVLFSPVKDPGSALIDTKPIQAYTNKIIH